jgi:F0F1-type ATP synthase assembly protein I
MPFHRPISDSTRPDPPKTGGKHALVQAEGLLQIAFVLPAGMMLGWGAGWGVDKLLHSHWATFTGLVLGIIGGMVAAIRMAIGAEKSLSGRDGS